MDARHTNISDNGNDISIAAWNESKNEDNVNPGTEQVAPPLTMGYRPWEAGVAKNASDPKGCTLNLKYVVHQTIPHSALTVSSFQTLAAILVGEMATLAQLIIILMATWTKSKSSNNDSRRLRGWYVLAE
ncbi:hypothetical protein AOQ84DRAFT_378234 [Glonium stellatum]|uniref:Uncharacterized protein n=1 Tax=Glonium stellatum TaxID=574774 RepID=A0A8E2JRD8_9PEZI|nr:hypothetical protein AOQ84DRAFT_378234 [Glonium stellatum]